MDTATTSSVKPPSRWKLHGKFEYWAAVVGAIALMTGAFLLLRTGAQPEAGTQPQIDLAWYTTDDGKTWFSDAKNKLAPFDHKGAQAVRCWIYSCDGGNTKFAAYLERFTPAAKTRLDSLLASKQPASPGEIEQLMATGAEVKRPGDATWVSASSSRGLEIRDPTCPPGSGKHPQLILPTKGGS
jgi:hypothetical protein